jgi:hypothetical protein
MKKNLLFIVLLFAATTNAQSLLTGMPLPDGDVYAFEKMNSTIYFGGFFNNVNGSPRSHIASFNATTGALNSWNPVIDNGVTTITRVGTKLIAGGSFTSVDAQTRFGICMFDIATGNLDSWSDTANFTAWRQGVGAYNNTFYYSRLINFSGDFKIVCVDALTGNYTAWQSDSAMAGSVNAIYASGSYVYIGGTFNFTGGNSVYNNLCRFNQNTGALDTSWHPQPQIANFGITSIVKTNSHIFIGGDFNVIAGQNRKGVAAFEFNGNLSAFNQNSSAYEVLSLFADGNYIWVGGNSYLLGGQSRYRIAQIRISNSAATCWNASATSSSWSTVQALYVSEDTVYTGPFGNPRLSVFTGSPLPQSSPSVTGPDTVLSLQSATYSVPLISGYTYTWIITGGSGSSTTNSINVNWGSGPVGNVSVIVNNPLYTNCYSDTISLPIVISASINIFETEAGKDFIIYPNPSKGSFTAKCNILNTQLKIVDVTGRVMFEQKLNSQLSTINYQLAPGIYFVELCEIQCGGMTISDEQRSFRQKLLIE